MKTLHRYLVAAAVIMTFGIASTARAVPITGQVDFSGGATLDTMSLGTATQVVSWQAVSVQSISVGSILDTTINVGDAVTMTAPWSFTAGKAALWTVGGFTFNLATSGIVTQTNTFLNVFGTGTIVGNGYDATPGSWAFTSQNILGGENATFSFSSTTAAQPAVPDSGTSILLLGAGLTLVGLVARTRKFFA